MAGRALAGVAMVVGLLGPAGPAARADGVWVWPLAGPRVVSRPFDPPATRYGPGHRGADLAGAPGQAVLAGGAGRVSYAGLLAGRGVVVVVHGDLRTTYEPVIASVRVGAPVRAGEPLGRLAAGHAGCPTGCLHWGLLRGAVYLDPVQLVRRGPSRLLPLDRPLPAAAAARDLGPTGPGRATAAPEPAPRAQPGWARPAERAALGGLLVGATAVSRRRRATVRGTR